MTASEGEEPSFDPRTWAIAPAAGRAGPESASPGQPTPSARRPEGPGTFPRAHVRADIRRIAAAGAIVVLLASAALAAFWTGHAGHTKGAAAPPDAQSGAPTGLRCSVVLAAPGDLNAALTAVGVSPDDARAAASAAVAALGPGEGDLHATIYLQPDGAGVRLASLELRHEDGSGAVVRRSGARFSAQTAKAAVKVEVKDVRGEMDANDFYSSAVAAGVPDSLIHDFAQAFTFDVDFQREVKPGDIFEAVFTQALGASGEPVREPELLFVLLTTQAKSIALYRFAPQGQEAGWYDGNGRSIVRSFMRTPVEGARISSTFGMREHPVLGFMKMHKGVDFAAPIGTPIYAAGDGTVQHAEFKPLNGNWVEILHDNGWQTLYLHLNAFGPGVTPGARVRQGQQIGQVGVTGRSTGPHLHYEMHIDNQPVDPMTVPMQSGQALSGTALQAFVKERNRIDALRARQTG